MRGTIPTDNDFGVTQPPKEEKQAVNKEALELAKIGNSPQWKILQDYLDQRIQVYSTGLFGEDMSKVDTTIIGQRFLAAQSVIQEFDSLKSEINRTTETVNEALKDEKLREES